MSHENLYTQLLQTVRETYKSQGDLMAFLPFPADVSRQAITPYHCACADVMGNDRLLSSRRFPELQRAILAASPAVAWRETYKDTDIGDHFMEQFGCYAIIGGGGPFAAPSMRLWIVYMPPNLYYPWHHHPAEEMYFVVSGSAVFSRKGHPDRVLSEGDTMFHESNQPHAMATRGEPVLCLVAWRNGFDVPPVLTTGT